MANNEYNIGGEMSEDKANEMYMLLQQDTLPKVSDDYGLMQPVSAVSEVDNAHSAMDTKILENDLYNLFTQKLNKESGAMTMSPNEVKSGLGLLEIVGGAGAAYGVGKAIRPLLSKLMSAIKGSPWKNVPQVRKATGSSEVMKKLSNATGEMYSSPAITRTGHYISDLNKYGNVPGFPRIPNIPKPAVTGGRKVGVTTGKATQNDPLFESLKRFDSKGEKILPNRMIDFLLDK